MLALREKDMNRKRDYRARVADLEAQIREARSETYKHDSRQEHKGQMYDTCPLQEQAKVEESLRAAGSEPTLTDLWEATKLRTKAGQGL